MQQIADAAGVSVTTVSHALSGKRPVNPDTAARIHRLIDQFQYVPDAGARRLQSGRSRTIGLAVPDISHWYFGRIARGVEEAANEADHGLVVASTANADPRRERRYFTMLSTRAIDGLIYASSRSTAEIDELARLARSAPLVLADEPIESIDVPSVSTTVYEGALEAVTLLKALGHERVVAVAGYQGLPSTLARTRALHEVFPGALTFYGDFEVESGYRILGDLLAADLRFTAVFAHNDNMAIGAMRRLQDAGLRVPEDVSIIGFDDTDAATMVTPALTTVRKDMVEVGRQSGRLLLDRLNGTPVAKQDSVLLPTELVVRGSTGPAPATPRPSSS
ncbi:LacI family DNA-binding transcriptional regulator [Gryllotalpicola koreensis]|uniref:LacI family DNA-binding transcriptional regulator n=2 Tax=Gryllotalpicola koreensis TaxID=993086 RepID=A0ABP8A1B0_9MICO